MMTAMTSLHADKCCHLASKHEAFDGTLQQHSPVPDL